MTKEEILDELYERVGRQWDSAATWKLIINLQEVSYAEGVQYASFDSSLFKLVRRKAARKPGKRARRA